jgi:hypothetical protein
MIEMTIFSYPRSGHGSAFEAQSIQTMGRRYLVHKECTFEFYGVFRDTNIMVALYGLEQLL